MKRFLASLCIVAAAAGSALAQSVTVSPSATTYSSAGGQITVSVNFNFATPTSLPSAMAFEITVPAGWSYTGGSGSYSGDVPAARPATGATGPLGFAFSDFETATIGTVAFSFKLTYAAGLSGTQTLPVTVARYVDGVVGTKDLSVSSVTLTLAGGGAVAAPVISSPTTASATVGAAFTYQITASNTPTSYAATGLPAGLSLNTTTGVISGTPTTAGTSTVSLTATNSGGTSAAFSLVINVAKATGTVTITPSTLAQTYNGSPRAVAAATTPSGLNVIFTYQPTGGVASQAAPINAGSYAVVATIDSPNYQGSANGTLNVAKADQTINFATLPAKTVGEAAFTLSATAPGGTVTYTSSNTGVATVSGNTVTIVGAGTTTLTAKQGGDINYNPAPDVTQTLTVNAAAVAPSILTQPQSQTVTAGSGVTFSVVASGTAPLSYQWKRGTSNISGATHSSYTIPATTSVDAGSYFVTVSNSAGNVTSNAVTLTVNPPPPGINSATAATATVGESFSYQITASDPSASFAATNLPAGLSLNQVSGVISGVPTTAGTKQVSIVASNSGGNSPPFTLALTVNPRQLTVTLQGSVAKVYDGIDAALVRAANYQIGGLLPNDAITIAKSSGTYASAAAGGTLLDVEGVVRSWSMDVNKQGAFVNGTQYFVWTRITAGLGQFSQSPTPPSNWGKALNISGFSSLGGETGVTFKFGDLFLNESAFISGKDGANGGITVQEYVPQSGVATPVEFYDTAGALLAAGTMEKLVTRVAYTTGIATGEGRFTLNAAGTSTKSAAFMQELAQVTGGTGRLSFFISSYVAITGNSNYADYRSTGAISSAAATGKTVTVSLAPGDFTVGQGTSLANYTLPTTASGTVGVILKAPLTAKADNKVRTLGAANPPLTITYAGFVPGETKSAITEPVISTSADVNSQLGDYAITLTGGSAANYNLTLQNGTLSVVAKTVPVIDWVPTGPIVYGTALGNVQLNALAKTLEGANLPGSFVYTPASGTVLNAGEQTLSVTFTPIDSVQYASRTVTTTLTVSPKGLTLALKGGVAKLYDGT